MGHHSSHSLFNGHIISIHLILLIWICTVEKSSSAEIKYSYNISEERPPRTYVGNILNDTNLRTMVSEDDHVNLRYSFLTQDDPHISLFSLDELSGDLRTSSDPNKSMDRESLCPFTAQCVIVIEVAIKSTIDQFFRTVELEIVLQDVNDNRPTFPKNETVVEISESVSVNTPFPIVGAQDRDAGVNKLQKYTLVPDVDAFQIEYTTKVDGTSEVNLLVKQELDYEIYTSYDLQLIAEDGGNPPLTGVLQIHIKVVDVNDNKPKFAPAYYNTTVNENVKAGTTIISVTATDADSGQNGDIVFRLSPHQSRKNLQLFSINSTTGALSVIGDLQNEEEEKYDIIVEASDRGVKQFTTQTVVTVKVLDTVNNPPRIRVNLLSSRNFSLVSEYANLGTVVAHIAVHDTDRGRNGIAHCQLLMHKYFELQGFDVNEYKVIVARLLDRELAPEHSVTIICQDAAKPPQSANASFKVRVTDENDNAPFFSQSYYTTSVFENNNVGDILFTVTASDPDEGINKNITYSLVLDTGNKFTILPKDGTIIANHVLDFETQKLWNLTVMAMDGGNPPRSTTAWVVINVKDRNDQSPQFTRPVFLFRVSEGIKPKQVIGRVTAVDKETGENGQIVYAKTTESSGNSPFRLFENGTIIVEAHIDYENISKYEFQVTATDMGQPPLSSSARVVISVGDKNDNPPQIIFPNVTHHSVTLTFSHPIGAVIAVIVADDGDSGANAKLRYVISSRNDSGRFQLDVNSGELYTTRALERKDVGVYRLMIMVQDEGIPPLASHVILQVYVIQGNGSAATSAAGFSEQNILITVSIICATAVISAVIVLVIIAVRRVDGRRNKDQAPVYVEAPNVITNLVDKVTVDAVRSVQGGNHGTVKGDEEFGFLPTSKGGKSKSSFETTNEVKDRSKYSEVLFQPDGKLDQVSVLRLHQTVLQTYHGDQLDSQQKVAAWQRSQDDLQSDTSGDTTTSDSGRGGSEVDINDVHDMSTQSSVLSPNHSSLKSAPKIPPRHSSRKHVTFSDSAPKKPPRCSVVPTKHSNIYTTQQPHPYSNVLEQIPQQERHDSKSANTHFGFTVRSPTFSNDDSSAFMTTSSFKPLINLPGIIPGVSTAGRENRVPMDDGVSHIRDWRNDSIATTDDGDDRSTTTSGSYTIDNDDHWLNLDYDVRDIVV
ncbi:protocadherin gamma-B4-like [Gigantopelta aegis]|uniref:protocadherin gamma-B4-like n=1 Tax=Gigantopelta aegis TaxID=1735272 RepID=UPI001B887398|nr:protocadherin gamma-B4-like [Gigantopelta aegis]